MPNLNAAMACGQLEMLPDFIQNKRELANLYANFFKELNITFITERDGTEANYWLNAILLNNLEQRDEFLEFTNSNNVMTRPGWELMHTLEMYKNSPSGDLANSIDIYNRLVNIPSSVRVNN